MLTIFTNDHASGVDAFGIAVCNPAQGTTREIIFECAMTRKMRCESHERETLGVGLAMLDYRKDLQLPTITLYMLGCNHAVCSGIAFSIMCCASCR